MKVEKTYREVLQRMISQLQKIYDEAEALRDCSGYGQFEGKAEMNFIRGKLPEIWGPLQKLDNGMSDVFAQSIVWEENNEK